jgi:hypothetical protein
MSPRVLLLATASFMLSTLASNAQAKQTCSAVVEKDLADQNGNQLILIPAGTYTWSNRGGVIERCADAAHEPDKEKKLSLLGHVFFRGACERQIEKRITCKKE